MHQYFGDILSTFEKEILIYAKLFLRSRPSNWSFNVQGHRFARYEELPYDRYVFDIFKNKDGKLPSLSELKEIDWLDTWWEKTKKANYTDPKDGSDIAELDDDLYM